MAPKRALQNILGHKGREIISPPALQRPWCKCVTCMMVNLALATSILTNRPTLCLTKRHWSWLMLHTTQEAGAQNNYCIEASFLNKLKA